MHVSFFVGHKHFCLNCFVLPVMSVSSDGIHSLTLLFGLLLVSDILLWTAADVL